MHGLLPETRSVPLAALAPDRTYYLTSTSKTLAPGLRIAYVLAPAPMVPRLTDLGHPLPLASLVMSLCAGLGVAGKLSFGWLGDKLPIRRILLFVIAAQFTGMNGLSARALFACTARAISSFPVPLSP